MVTSDQLLQLIAHLQYVENPTYGRNMLLKYMRKQSGAQLAILFILDKEQQTLLPLAYSGKMPASLSSDLTTNSTYSLKGLMKKTVPVAGLFGSVLLTQNLLHISNIDNDPRLLTEERAWTYPAGHILLNAIKAGESRHNEQGVLLLNFAPGNKDMPEIMPPTFNEGDLKICSVLLSTYLIKDVNTSRRTKSTPRQVHRSRRHANLERETTELLQKLTPQRSTLPEVMYSLTTLSDLYEIGLVPDTSIDIQDLYQHILSHLARVIQARFACLLLYHPSLRSLLPVAQLGEGLSPATVVDAIDDVEMKRLTMLGPGEIISSFTIDGQRILLVTLSHNCVLLGIVALAASDSNVLPDERGLLLNYMGNVAALIIRNHSIHVQEQQAAIEHERSRIARDIHDGAAQQIAHVLHKIEFIQRLLERQPLISPLSQTALMEIENAYDLLESGLSELRQSISSLLPIQLEGQDFVTALHNLLDEHMINDPGLTISSDIDEPGVLPATLEAPIFRFIQEALTNVRKHAQATHVTVSIRMSSNVLIVEVHDNGAGFYPEAGIALRRLTEDSLPHIGLRAMRERIQEAGGNLEIESNLDKGTSIKARFTLVNSAQLLTAREHEVLRLIIAGLTNRAIAQKLSISLETVKSHVHHIMQKMQVKDRTQAAVLATRQGWL